MKKNIKKHRPFIITALVLIAASFFAIASISCQNSTKNKEIVENDTEDIEMPQFPGGQKALTKFIIDNVQYPEECRKNGIEGKVMVNFTVSTSGQLNNIKVAEKVHELLDQEALRVVSIMPVWIPGKKNGAAIDMEMTLPIAFKLGEKK